MVPLRAALTAGRSNCTVFRNEDRHAAGPAPGRREDAGFGAGPVRRPGPGTEAGLPVP
jgi:hypothetical protein